MFVRSSESYTHAPRRRGMTFVAVAIALVYLFLTGLSTVWTDFLWFDSVGFDSVWRTNLVTSVGLAVAGVIVVFGVVWGNLWLTDRISPRIELLDLGEDEELIERFRDWVEPRLRFVRLGVAAAFALLLGAGLAAWRDEVLLFLNPVTFGQADPQFGADLGFYMFRMPFWELLTSWFFNLGVLTFILVATVHYLNGGIRLRQGTRLTMRPGAKAHLSALAAALAAIRAIGYWIDSRELLYSGQSSFFGAGYTDINARLPALQLLAIVSVLAAVLFLWNIRRPDWTLAIVSVGAWAFVSVAAGLIYPAIVQRFTVQPNELARESEFISLNVAATRNAFGLDDVEVRPFEADRSLTRADIEANRLTVDNLRLWDPGVLTRTYQNLQEIRAYYRVDSVDTDRYIIDGVPTQVLVSARELDESSQSIPTDWQNQVLSYTHGFGAVLSPANAVESDGQPSLFVRDVPPISDFPELELEQSRIYFGESYNPDKPVIVRTGEFPQEVDLPVGQVNNFNEYDGDAGVEIGGFLRRLAYALRYRDLNILISSQLRDDSRILQTRNIEAMVERVAPFLHTDADPYPVLMDGRVMWLLDLYTISDKYPYSQPVTINDTLRLSQSSGLPRAGFNYIRNSVKASIDAFDGTIKLYVVDPTDPVVTAWRGVYPDLFTDDPVPQTLEDHFRYPQDLFKIQSEKYLDYHVIETGDFFRRSDSWSIPRDPSTIDRDSGTLLWGDGLTADGRTALLDRFLPNYLLVNLPGEDDLSYVIIQPFTPQNKLNMSSFLVGDSTPGRYGRLVDFRLPSGTLVEGTGQVGDRINQNSDIAQQLTLWDQEGSNVLFGDMLVVPIEESILYVMPVYLAAEAGGGLPEFRRVITVFGDTIRWDSTLEGALDQVFGAGAAPDPDEPPDTDEPPQTDDGTIEELLAEASDRFDRARLALRAGDLAEYQRLFEEAEDLVNRALALVDPSLDAGMRGLFAG
ncbi:MAG TPA: UPF0182 family protein [Acidimicrobiia bacterium]|nr:UPF0182 family protein [Acidimicrobiia bacterium]